MTTPKIIKPPSSIHTHGRDKHAHGRAHVPLFGLSVNKKVDRKVDKK